jgi:hypothetical protein
MPPAVTWLNAPSGKCHNESPETTPNSSEKLRQIRFFLAFGEDEPKRGEKQRAGFQAGKKGKPSDGKTVDWHRGWADAQE